MLAREVPDATLVAKTTDHTRRSVIEGSAIGRLFGQSFLDITPDDLGKRQATFASLGSQPPRLLIGELNLRPHHDGISVSTS